MKLYHELAEWWPAFYDPAEFRREAAHFAREIRLATNPAAHTLLELGSGGGTAASFLKKRFAMTLVDISPRMLKVSRAINPECAHVRGDIRRLRLGRTFDAVFAHDAICHMVSEPDLEAVMETAYVHLRPGGVALFVPDFVKETFVPGTDQGGQDAQGRSVRFLQWMVDADPADTRYTVDFAIMVRSRDGRVRVVHDRHSQGLFPRARWLELLRRVGFRPAIVRHGEIREAFIARRPLRSARSR
jgi:SAM-dependent methyltransferase